jgi:hypothetical protein
MAAIVVLVSSEAALAEWSCLTCSEASVDDGSSPDGVLRVLVFDMLWMLTDFGAGQALEKRANLPRYSPSMILILEMGQWRRDETQSPDFPAEQQKGRPKLPERP